MALVVLLVVVYTIRHRSGGTSDASSGTSDASSGTSMIQ